MKAFLVLARLRALEVTRSRVAATLFLALPMVLMLVVGVVFANGHPFERRRVALVAPEGEGASVVAALEAYPELKLEREPSEAAARGKLKSRMANAVLVVEDGRARLLLGPGDRIFGRGLAGALPEPPSIETIDVPRWGYVHYLFPGILTYAVMLAGLFGMGYSMVRFRQNLFLKKLATTPLSRASFVAAQIAARSFLVLLQMALLVAAACLAFGLPMTAIGAVAILGFTLLGLLAFMGAGFVMACLIKTEAVMIDAIFALALPVVFLSEFFFPADVLPGPLPALASALPSTQMVRLTRSVILYGTTDLGQLWPGVAILLAWTVATYALSLAVFRWHR